MCKIAILFYRTLVTQSAASVSASYLATHGRNAGHHVELIQLNRSRAAQDISGALRGSYDVVFYKPNFKDVDRLGSNILALQERDPSTRIVLFGPFAVLNATAILDTHPAVIGVLLPDHEAIVHELIPRLLACERGATLVGLIHRCLDGRVESAHGGLKTALLSFMPVRPARDVELSERVRFANLEASRGCSRKCTFCHVPANGQMGAGKVLRREVSDVVAEMRALSEIGKSYLIFNDPILGGAGPEGIEWLWNFQRALAANPLPVFFMGYFTFDYFTSQPALIAALAKVGLIRVFVGIESAAKDRLRNFRKGVNVSEYARVKNELAALNVVPHIGFMLFSPFATPDEVAEGLRFLHRSGELHRFGVIAERTRLVPGSLLLEEVAEAKLLESRDFQTLGHGYRFAHLETARLFDAFAAAFKAIGIARLERIEHVLVMCEFLTNLMRKIGSADAAFERNADRIATLKSNYCDDFLQHCLEISVGDTSIAEWRAKSVNSWKQSEELFSALIESAKAAGLEDPLSWLPSGNLDSEPNRDANYDGHLLTTRSGSIV